MSVDLFKDAWRNTREPHERLRWARKYWQAKAGAIGGTSTDAAHSLGMRPNTYQQYEREPGTSRHTPLKHQQAIQFGRKFGVSWTWLITGNGDPFEDIMPPAQARVLEVMSSVDPEQQEVLATFVETFLAKRMAQ